MSLLLTYYNLNRLQLFIGILLANLLIVWLSKSLLINEIVIYNTFSEQLTYDRSVRLFEEMKRLAWISYAFLPIIMLLKFSLVSLVIYVGVVFCNLQSRISLSSVFKVVMASEIVFIVVSLIKFGWFYLFAGNYDLNDMGFFYPLSLINIFSLAEVDKVWIFPLQTANLFQILYIILLAYGLNNVCEIKKSVTDKLVLLTYLPALLIWVALIMFLSIDILV
jgi:hypothetical protein